MVGIGLGGSLEKNLRKVESFRAKGQLDRALKQLQDWARKHPDTPHYQFEAAMVAFDLGDWGTGITALRGLVRALPDTRDKVLGACRERFDESRTLALGEFLVEQALVDLELTQALDLIHCLAPDDLSIFRRKHGMRHQSLVATGNARANSLLTSHCLQFLLGCAEGDGALVDQEVAALLELDGAPRPALDPIVQAAIEAHGEAAGMLMARGRLRMVTGGVAAGVTLAVAAARADARYVDAAAELADGSDPGDHHRGRWLLARGDLAVLRGDGSEAARLFTECADADPDLRDALLERLETAAGEDLPQGTAEIAKLRLRLLVVQKRFDDIPDLTQELLRDEVATAQEIRSLLGEGRSDGLPPDMLVVMAETALRDGDLSAAALHANEIPTNDHTSLNRLLRAVESLLPDWPEEGRLELEALHAVVLARVQNQDAANTRLAGMWDAHVDQIDILLPITDRCLETVEPQPILLRAALATAIDHDRGATLAPILERALRAGAEEAMADGPGMFDQENLSLDMVGGEDISADIGLSLVDLLEERPDRSGTLLELLDGMPTDLGLPHRLRHPLALAALWSGDRARALPEISVLSMMAEPEFVRRLADQLDVAIADAPDDADLLTARAELLIELDDVEAASELLSRALSVDPTRAEDLTQHFEHLIGRATPEEAPRLWRGFADSLFAAGRFGQLNEVCRRALDELAPDQAGPFLELRARTMLEEGKLSDALQFVQKQLVGGRLTPDRAVAVLEDVLQAHPASSIGHLMLGQAAARANSIDRAIDGYLGAVRLDESLAGPVGEQIHKIASRPGTQGRHLVRVAQFQLARGDQAGGADLLDTALRIDSALADRVLNEIASSLRVDEPSVDLLVIAARAARLAGDVERACEMLIALDGRDPARFEIVLGEFRQLRNEFPNRLLPVLCMARVLIEHEAPEAAAQTIADASRDTNYALEDRIEMLREFDGRMPSRPVLALAYAQRLAEQRRIDDAVQRLRDALEGTGVEIEDAVEVARSIHAADTTHAAAGLLLHDLLLRAGDVAGALEAVPAPEAVSVRAQTEISERLEAQRDRVVDRPALASVLARSFVAQNREGEAIEVLTEAAARTGETSGHPLWVELASLLHRTGDVDGARTILLKQAYDENTRREAYQRFESWSRERLDVDIEILEGRHRERPRAVHVAMELASRLLDAGRADEVPGILGQAPVTGEWKVQRAVLLGRAHLETNRADRAAIVMRSATSVAGDDEFGHELFYWLAEAENRLGRPAAATAHLSRVVDSPALGSRADQRIKQTYGQYLEDVSGRHRAVLSRISSL